jgi:hypothetical protein
LPRRKPKRCSFSVRITLRLTCGAARPLRPWRIARRDHLVEAARCRSTPRCRREPKRRESTPPGDSPRTECDNDSRGAVGCSRRLCRPSSEPSPAGCPSPRLLAATTPPLERSRCGDWRPACLAKPRRPEKPDASGYSVPSPEIGDAEACPCRPDAIRGVQCGTRPRGGPSCLTSSRHQPE